MSFDPRVIYSRPSNSSFAYGGRTFSYQRHDPASEQQALRDLEAFALSRIEKLERYAGRRLTTAEIVDPTKIKHAEDRSTYEKVIANSWKPTVEAKPAVETNPYSLLPDRRRKETPAEAKERLMQEWQNRQALKSEETQIDPRRTRARERASELRDRILYDETMPASMVAEVERLARQAAEGLLTGPGSYVEMEKALREKLNERIDARRQEGLARVEEIQRELDDLPSDPFEPPTHS